MGSLGWPVGRAAVRGSPSLCRPSSGPRLSKWASENNAVLGTIWKWQFSGLQGQHGATAVSGWLWSHSSPLCCQRKEMTLSHKEAGSSEPSSAES